MPASWLQGSPRSRPAPASAAPATEAALSVTVTCFGTQCDAAAYGGSGTYTSLEWTNAVELWEAGNVSAADASSSCGPGYMVPVNAFVMDRNGVGAMGGTWVFCP